MAFREGTPLVGPGTSDTWALHATRALGPGSPRRHSRRAGDPHGVARGEHLDESRRLGCVRRVELVGSGRPVLHYQRAERFEDRCEHFGFRDGIAQPARLGYPLSTARRTPARPGGLGWQAPGRWASSCSVVRTAKESPRRRPPAVGRTTVPTSSSGSSTKMSRPSADSSTRLVATSGWPGASGCQARREGGRTDAAVRCRLVRRIRRSRRSGPHQSTSGSATISTASCPVGAHIRRANPRMGSAWADVMTTRHRLMRRGLPYGPQAGPRGVRRRCRPWTHVRLLRRGHRAPVRVRPPPLGDRRRRPRRGPPPRSADLGTAAAGTQLKVPAFAPYFLAPRSLPW